MNIVRPVPIMENLRKNAELQASALRVISRPEDGRRLYEMPDGSLLTIWNEQPANSRYFHAQAYMEVSREDAEDFWGWTR